jgi:peptidoglycan hydrolase CwlO-like protein
VIGVAQADATIWVAIVGGITTILAAIVGVQWKVHTDNRRDHGDTAAKVDRLLDHQSEIQRDVQYIRADVTDIHGALTELRRVDSDTNSRVTRLERKQTSGDDAA